VELISKEAYGKDIELAGMFLQGKDESLNKLLQKNMESASKNLKFEEAAGWRDRINALRRVQSHQSITSGHSDIDIITQLARQSMRRSYVYSWRTTQRQQWTLSQSAA